MKFVTVSGPPSTGKTSVLLRTIAELTRTGQKVGVVKFDCLSTSDDQVYAARGIPVRKGLSGAICPDHYFVSNVEEVVAWGEAQGLDMLLSESAGLCNRCSPHIKGVLAVCVVDNLSGVDTPRKIGPMLRSADIVTVTKGDIVSQAEREVFARGVSLANPRAMVLHVNGITGQGASELAALFLEAPEMDSIQGRKLRFSMPAASCSYCLGETRIGARYQQGNVRKMKMED